MTRETKIGMLVGLAFIIVIGILLSDHMTSTNEPPKAPLASAGDDVRRGTTTPAPAEVPTTTMVIPPPAPPITPIPTRQDLNSPPPAPVVQDIRVGPGAAQGGTAQAINVQGGNPPAAPQGGVDQSPVIITSAADAQPIVPSDPAAGAPAGRDALEQWASEHPSELQVVDPTGQPQRPQPAPMQAVREYKAQPGDSLSRMASRLMGGNTKANRDALIKANPALRQNPDRVIVGRTYIIPPVATQVVEAPVQQVAERATPAAPAPLNTPAPSPTPAPAPAPAALPDGHHWYTVKENDNLWKIAADQLGSGNEWTRIKELNKDILKGAETVHPNMRLRLPGKPSSASASAS